MKRKLASDILGMPRGAASPQTESEGFEANHKRCTFWIHNEVRDAIQQEHDRSGRSRTRIVDEALRQALGLPPRS